MRSKATVGALRLIERFWSRLRFVAAFTWFYGYSSMRRGPWFVLSYLSLPLSLLFFIYVISHGQYLDYGILGGLLGIMSGNALTSIGDFVFLKTQLKLQDLLVATQDRKITWLVWPRAI